jgi:hypothetical protein
MRPETEDLIARLSAHEVRTLKAALIAKEKDETRSLAIQVAAMLAAQLRFLGHTSMADDVTNIGNQLASGGGW